MNASPEVVEQEEQNKEEFSQQESAPYMAAIYQHQLKKKSIEDIIGDQYSIDSLIGSEASELLTD